MQIGKASVCALVVLVAVLNWNGSSLVAASRNHWHHRLEDTLDSAFRYVWRRLNPHHHRHHHHLRPRPIDTEPMQPYEPSTITSTTRTTPPVPTTTTTTTTTTIPLVAVNTRIGKTGLCPLPETINDGRCESTCRLDVQCTGMRKCCPTQCGSSVCIEAAIGTSPNVDFNDKPGYCPAKPTGPWICSNRCAQDADCRGTKKCCKNRCGAMACIKSDNS